MNLHLNKELFREFIDNLNTKTGIDSDIIEKDAEKYIQIVCLINKFDDSPNNKSTHDEMMDYAFQTETIPLIFEYKNVLGEIHSYELIVKLQCDLSLPNGNVEKPKCSPTLKLISWKPLQ